MMCIKLKGSGFFSFFDFKSNNRKIFKIKVWRRKIKIILYLKFWYIFLIFYVWDMVVYVY